MGEGYGRTFESLRPYFLERLVEVRGAIDPAWTQIAPDAIRVQLDQVLDRMQSYLTDGDAARYRGFANRWVALRLGEGLPPENVIHALVAVGDVIVQVARHRLGPGDDGMRFIRAATEMSFIGARSVVEIFADELRVRQRQRGLRPGNHK
jgi:hypothetical protein